MHGLVNGCARWRKDSHHGELFIVLRAETGTGNAVRQREFTAETVGQAARHLRAVDVEDRHLAARDGTSARARERGIHQMLLATQNRAERRKLGGAVNLNQLSGRKCGVGSADHLGCDR